MTETSEVYAVHKRRWFWLRNENGFPVACIASELMDCPDAQVRYALSIVNPKDHFDRRRGREIALGRIAKGKVEGEVPREGAKMAILGAIAGNFKLPDRVRKAAADWMGRRKTAA